MMGDEKKDGMTPEEMEERARELEEVATQTVKRPVPTDASVDCEMSWIWSELAIIKRRLEESGS